MNTIKNDTEKLKKELWHIKKVALPNLEEKISSSSNGGVDTTEIENRLTTLEGGFSSLSTQTETNSTAIGTLDDEVTEIATNLAEQNKTLDGHLEKINSNEENISSLTTSLSDIVQVQSTLTDKVEGLQTFQTTTSNKLSTLEGAQSSLSDKITSLEETQSSHTQKITTLEETLSQHGQTLETISTEQTTQNTRITRVEEQCSRINTVADTADTALFLADDNTLRIVQVENEVTTLRQQVAELQNSSGGSGDTTELENKITALDTRVTALESTVNTLSYDLWELKGLLGL